MQQTARKQQLLKAYRRKKRIAMLLCLFALGSIGFYAGLLWLLPCLLLLWVVHEVRFSDHIFYSPDSDYYYQFAKGVDTIPVSFAADRLTLAGDCLPHDNDTLILAIELRANLLGYWFDPAIEIWTDSDQDRQSFERGGRGLRYLNLTGFAKELRENGLCLQGRYCRLAGTPRLLRIKHPDYRQKRLLIIAPHADDAELAAFGLYSQAKQAWIVTLSAGEIEAEHYREMGLSETEASRIKGRLRSWDSIAAPIWGNVPPERSIQLGYFCLKLAAMRRAPEQAFASEAAELGDTRLFRAFNQIKLASDANGLPTWQNLVADLREIILRAEPEVIVLPHPHLDPHPDHVAASVAVKEALTGLAWQAELLYYANHLHDTDRWPMGDAHCGVPLPPFFGRGCAFLPYALPLDKARQIDKSMALAMMHDLGTPISGKEACRRLMQRLFAGRRQPPYGANAYFRKAARRHELFFLDSANLRNTNESTL